jgi:uncharacterized repeat protein (TIGR01451 family)
MKLLLALLVLLATPAAWAADGVSLSSEVFVEREVTDAEGRTRKVLEAPEMVTPGERLVFVLTYRNGGAEPATDFVVTNPLPSAVAYAGPEGEEPVVSVDGGSEWGELASLEVREADGSTRAAAPGDVTHVRWTLARAIPAGASGKLSFRGIVK